MFPSFWPLSSYVNLNLACGPTLFDKCVIYTLEQNFFVLDVFFYQLKLNQKKPTRSWRRPPASLCRYKCCPIQINNRTDNKFHVAICQLSSVHCVNCWNLTLKIRPACVFCLLIIWQESVELLGQFKEFMVTYNKVYSSQEGESLTPRIVQTKNKKC